MNKINMQFKSSMWTDRHLLPDLICMGKIISFYINQQQLKYKRQELIINTELYQIHEPLC